MARRSESRAAPDPGRRIIEDSEEGNVLVPVEGSEGRYILVAEGDELPYDPRVRAAVADPRVRQEFPPTAAQQGATTTPPTDLQMPVPAEQLATQPPHARGEE